MSGTTKVLVKQLGGQSDKQTTRKSYNPQNFGTSSPILTQISNQLGKHLKFIEKETHSTDISRNYASGFGETSSIKTSSSWKKPSKAQETSFRKHRLSRDPLQ